ncbi:MAG: CopG family transcriptional regulator [Candidatus Bathyarchaeia archaeon]
MSEKIEDLEMKKVPDLDSDESLVRVQIMLPEKWLKKLKDLAYERDVSRGSIVREALRKYFEEIEKPAEPNPEAVIPDKELDALLNECTTYYGGFEIDGEDGFIAKFSEKGWKLKDLTPEQWRKVKEKLQIGYEGYFIKPSLEEFAEKFEPLEPSEEQYAWFSTEESEETEED